MRGEQISLETRPGAPILIAKPLAELAFALAALAYTLSPVDKRITIL
jgi:hypothetical protein